MSGFPTPAPIHDAWFWVADRAHHSQPLPMWAALAVMVVVTAATLGKAWHITQYPATLAHELGHAYVGNICGRTVSGIKLSPDTSGVTHSAGNPTGLGYILTVAAGYSTPPLVGAACAWAALHGWAGLALFLLCALLILALPLVRNLLALAIMVGTIAPSLYALTENNVRWTTAVVQAIGAYLGVAGVRGVIALRNAHTAGRGAGSDADQLHIMTRVPSTTWVAMFATVAGLSVLAQVVFVLDPKVL